MAKIAVKYAHSSTVNGTLYISNDILPKCGAKSVELLWQRDNVNDFHFWSSFCNDLDIGHGGLVCVALQRHCFVWL